MCMRKCSNRLLSYLLMRARPSGAGGEMRRQGVCVSLHAVVVVVVIVVARSFLLRGGAMRLQSVKLW